MFDVAQTGSLRFRRLATCDTADCQSALRSWENYAARHWQIEWLSNGSALRPA